MWHTPRPVRQSDALTEFDCGQTSLNNWLSRRALTNETSGASRCLVSTDGKRVSGFYALAAGSVLRAETSARLSRGMPDPIPIILLARLAVDKRDQGGGLGAALLRDAIERVVSVSDIVGVRAILVHAINTDAARFYERHGFGASPVDRMHLMLLIKDARATLSAGR